MIGEKTHSDQRNAPYLQRLTALSIAYFFGIKVSSVRPASGDVGNYQRWLGDIVFNVKRTQVQTAAKKMKRRSSLPILVLNVIVRDHAIAKIRLCIHVN